MNAESWPNQIIAANQLSFTSRNDTLEFQTNGSDPYLVVKSLLNVDRNHADSQRDEDLILQWEYFCPQGLKGLQLRFGPPFRRSANVLPDMPPSEGWTTWSVCLADVVTTGRESIKNEWRFDFGTQADVRFRIRKIRLRPMSKLELQHRRDAEQREQRKRMLAEDFNRYFQTDMPARIEEVTIGIDNLRLRGSVAPSFDADDLALVFLPIHVPSCHRNSDPESFHSVKMSTIDSDGNYDVAIPLNSVTDDLGLCARVQIVETKLDGPSIPRSHARYLPVKPLDHHRPLPPPPPLRGAKGLTCITPRYEVHHLRELGLRHMSVNLPLVDLLSATERPGFEPITIHGRRWHVNRRRLESYDRSVKIASNAGAVVAGILLLPFKDPQSHPLIHPEANSAGTYAMPNLTQQDSVELYVATLDLIADRYARGDNRYGRIDHWIIHNEVDYGWQWTNMGEQPIELFLDHYAKSMRLADSCMRRVNSHARVFISLTHRWNVPDDQPWKTYAPRELLNRLIRHSRIEGDFPWGIAYHPYPQSLWNSAAWNDSQVSDQLDTKLITIRNLPVLEKFVQSKSARISDGSVRPILLSEQGFHAPPNDPDALQRQCAALLYTFQQIRKCPSILAFDYHRPNDHPDEGGLMLGLRGPPSREHPLGVGKPAWKVYRAINTDSEHAFAKRYSQYWKSSAGQITDTR